jgi:cytoskeleton protein RodZ
MSSLIAIDGTLIKTLRERKGLSQQDLAAWACLSVKQVKQIEEGGTSSFYNDDIKRKATLRLAVLLDAEHQQSPTTAAVSEAPVALTVRAEALHPLANPPHEADMPTVSTSANEAPAQPALPQSVHEDETSESGPQRGSQVMLWVSVVVAIGVVAYGLGF